ncbi:MAG: hypothetical protein J3Q66DRAFT_359850 [Benniella sp.]|nr:MAG: hypothetical protein J3Q66DRAFT_359850 [Benniella sp.]
MMMPRRAFSLLSNAPLMPLFIHLISRYATAQPTFQPQAAFRPYFSSVDGQALFIGGGSAAIDAPFPSNQAFAINLTTSWNTSHPPYENLLPGPATTSDKAASALSADGRQWLVYSEEGAHLYDIGVPGWSTLFKTDTNATDLHPENPSAVTDPASGIVYILPKAVPTVEEDGSSAASMKMMRVNLTSKALESVAMPFPAVSTMGVSSSFFYSASLGKLVLIRGETVNTTMDGTTGQVNHYHWNMFTYSVQDGWLEMKGDSSGAGAAGGATFSVPEPRKGACMVPWTSRGSKMILFGGLANDQVKTQGDISILDIATMTWTQGPEVAQMDRRAHAACAVSNDQLIVWGGQSDDGTAHNSTLIFNLQTNTWTTLYQARTSSSSSYPDTPLASNPHSTRMSYTLIVIIAACILVIGLLVGTIILCRRKRRRVNARKVTPPPPPPASQNAYQGHRYYDPLDNKLAPVSAYPDAIFVSPPSAASSPRLQPPSMVMPGYSDNKSTVRLIPLSSSAAAAASSASPPSSPPPALLLDMKRPVSDETLVQRLPAYIDTTTMATATAAAAANNTGDTPPVTPTSYLQEEGFFKQASPHPHAMILSRMSTEDNESMNIYFCSSVPVTDSFFADMETGQLRTNEQQQLQQQQPQQQHSLNQMNFLAPPK